MDNMCTNKCVHISSVSDMRTINVYAYRLCPICILPALVCISDMDDMRTTCSGTHIVCVRYAYNQCVRISDTDNMRTRAGSTHIRHRRYLYNGQQGLPLLRSGYLKHDFEAV